MVPRRGLEPPCLAATASKAVVSAISPPGRVDEVNKITANRKRKHNGLLINLLCFFFYSLFLKTDYIRFAAFSIFFEKRLRPVKIWIITKAARQRSGMVMIPM